MARAAVKAKQAQQGKKKAVQPAPRRTRGRRRHAGGGNPNQQLFFMRLRRNAKFMYVILAVLFFFTFAFLGVGSGTNGLDQLFSGLNIFHRSGNAVGKAQSYITKHPNSPKGYRDLATAYEAKGDASAAISALQQYTTKKPKDAKAWTELGGLQLTQAQTYLTEYQNAYQAQQLAAPSTPFLPTGKLGTALGTNHIEQAASSQAGAIVSNFQQSTQTAYTQAVSSFDRVTKLQPKNSEAWLQLAQTAQSAGDTTSAVKGYKTYLKLNPASPSAAQIRQLIKQLSPRGSG